MIVGGAVTLATSAGTQLLTSWLGAKTAARTAEEEKDRLAIQITAEREKASDAAREAERAETRPLLKRVAFGLVAMVEQISQSYVAARFTDRRPSAGDNADSDAIKHALMVLAELELEVGPDHPLVIAAGDCVRAAGTVLVFLVRSMSDHKTDQDAMVRAAAENDMVVMRSAQGAFFRLTAHSVGSTIPADLPNIELAEHEASKRRPTRVRIPLSMTRPGSGPGSRPGDRTRR
ncbi:MAG: hypothetical protein EON59_14930, partial [Alphaproteobacteria bacterium]